MSTINVRVEEKEKELIQKFAEFNSVSVSELVKTSVLEKIEDAQDLKTLKKAKTKNNGQKGKSITQVMQELDLL